MEQDITASIVLQEQTLEKFYDYRSAAEYTGQTENKIRNLTKNRTGPEFVKPSPRTTLFTQSSLDRWMATWKTIRAGGTR